MIRTTSHATFTLILLFCSTTALAQQNAQRTMLNANLSGKAELLALPHLDEATVAAVIKNRPYLSLSALDSVIAPAIGREATDSLYTMLSVPINLNTAPNDEILLIPGVGPRMAHEFEEYRPYIAIAQFRREIGKYVDDDEVARLEQYVFVPINLNTATDEHILSIPGVGNRMLHEFKEYRPYANIRQFRREIGKYVDDDELARLERFVTL